MSYACDSSPIARTSLSRSGRVVYTCGVTRTQLMFSQTIPTVWILYLSKSAPASCPGVVPSIETPQIAHEYSGRSDVCSFTFGMVWTRVAQ